MVQGSSQRMSAKGIVGRGRERSVLRAVWESVRNTGNGQVVAVEGEAGMGKTMLVEDFLDELTAPAVRASGIDSEPPVPWGVLEQILAQLPGVPGADRGVPPPDPQANSAMVGVRLAGYLRDDRSHVIFLDDAQWADEESLTVVLDTIRLLRGDLVLFVIAYRPNAGSPFPSSSGSARPEAWRKMLEGENAVPLRLEGLPPEDILRLATDHGLRGLSLGNANRLQRASGGNPGYLIDMLPQLRTNPIVIDEEPLPVPASHVSAVARTLGSCDPRTRTVVSAAAVLGRRFSVAAVRHVSGVQEPRNFIMEAVGKGLLAEVPGAGGRECTFPQSVTRDAILQAIDRHVLADLHRRCADMGDPRDEEVLRHRIAAADGVDELLAVDLRGAARRRKLKHDLSGAAYYLMRAMDCTEPGPARTGLMLTAVEALLVVGRERAVDEYAGELVRAPADPWRNYVLGYQRMLAGTDSVMSAVELLQGALSALDRGAPVPTDAPADLRARIATQMAVLSLIILSYPDMIRYGTAAVDAGSDDTSVRGLAWVARTVGMTLSGDSAQALDMLSDAGQTDSASGLDGLAARGIIRLWTDDLPGAADDLRMMFSRGVRGEALRATQAIGFLGEVEYRLGRLEDAARYTELAVDNATDNGRYWDNSLLHALATYPRAAQAERDKARDHARKSERHANEIGAPAFLAYAAGAKAAIAQADDNAPALLSAAEQIEAHYDSREPGTHLFGPVRADALARLNRPDEAAEALQPFLDGAVMTGRRSARMCAARVAAEIARARGDHELAVQECRRADALARELGMPLEVGRVALTEARCHALTDRPRRTAAARALHAAYRDFVLIGATAYAGQAKRYAEQWRLRLDQAPDPLDDLTPRQRQAARLVAKGLTNKKIRDQMGISEKTLQNHLTATYKIFDVKDRKELKRLLDQD
jgi:DNA-binding CsgD family transcriptional regulator